MAGQGRENALDHVVVVMFENRSLDNVLGRPYGPGDGKTFEGVIGKDLSNPIPEWTEHGADRKVVPCMVAADMDSPNPDTGDGLPEHPRAEIPPDRHCTSSTTSSRSSFPCCTRPPRGPVPQPDPGVRQP